MPERRLSKSPTLLLRLVGPWLFDAALSRTKGFERGRAAALGTLCRVVARASNSVAEPPFWAPGTFSPLQRPPFALRRRPFPRFLFCVLRRSLQ